MTALTRKYGQLTLIGLCIAVVFGAQTALIAALACLAVRAAAAAEHHRRDALLAWQLYDDEYQANRYEDEQPVPEPGTRH